MNLFASKGSRDQIRFVIKNRVVYETTKSWKEGVWGLEIKNGSDGNEVIISPWWKELWIPFYDLIKYNAVLDFTQLYIMKKRRD